MGVIVARNPNPEDRVDITDLGDEILGKHQTLTDGGHLEIDDPEC